MLEEIRADMLAEDKVSPRINKRQFSPEGLANLKASGKKTGKLKIPTKGFGSNRRLASLGGSKSKSPGPFLFDKDLARCAGDKGKQTIKRNKREKDE